MQECVLLAFVHAGLVVCPHLRQEAAALCKFVLIDFVVQYCTAHTEVLLLCHGV